MDTLKWMGIIAWNLAPILIVVAVMVGSATWGLRRYRESVDLEVRFHSPTYDRDKIG